MAATTRTPQAREREQVRLAITSRVAFRQAGTDLYEHSGRCAAELRWR
jgi:hypothetical protein